MGKLAALVILLASVLGAQYFPPGGGGSGSGTVTSVGFTGGLVSVANPTTTPAFTVAGTSGGLPYFSAASTWASSAAGTINHVMGWGGAGSAPVDLGALPAGTVTSVATTGPITGGTITGAGTIACATCGVTGSPLSQFASTTSAQLLGTLSDATGTGAAVFGTAPTITSPKIAQINDANGNASIINAATTSAVDQVTITNAATAGHIVSVGATGSDTNIELALIPKGTGGVTVPVATASNPALRFTGDTQSGWYRQSGNEWMLSYSTTPVLRLGLVGLVNYSNHGYGWGSSDATSAPDTMLCRDSAGVASFYSTTCGTTAANYRALKLSAVIAGGTTFTATGLSVGTLVGGATAGTFALGANGPGTVVVTMGNTATAPAGWSCWVSDRTTLSVLVEQSASSTTTATFNYPAGALSGDVSNFGCLAY